MSGEEQLTLLSPELPARASPLPESDEACVMIAHPWPLNLLSTLLQFVPGGSSGKTSLTAVPQTTDETLQHFWDASVDGELAPLRNGEMLASLMDTPAPTDWHGGCWTLNFLESPSVVVESSLWDTLEDGPVPPKHYLSPTAARGLLNRARKFRVNLKPLLRRKLEQVILAGKS